MEFKHKDIIALRDLTKEEMELLEVVILTVSAESRLPAISNEVRVRVDAS